MRFFLALIGFFFLLFTFGCAVIVWKVRKHVRHIREAMRNDATDDAFQRMANKYYYRNKRDEGPMFDEDYFKGDPTGTRRKREQPRQHTRRTTRTDSGVTIYDDRDPSVANKKIFAQDEGEYVDFTESSD